MVGFACTGDGDGDADERPAPAASTTADASPTAAASPTASLGGPAADGARALEHVRQLSEVIGSRVAGTPEEIEARDYLKAELERYGYDVTVQSFQFDGTRYRPARVDAGGEPIRAIAFEGSTTGTVSGRLVAAGIGRPEEFPAGGLNGAIALIERGELTFTAKVANATAAGAGGAIVYNNEDGPLVASSEQGTIPVVGIDRDAGLGLAQRLASGTVDVSIEVLAPSGTAYNVVARPKGETSCRIVSGGHYDSVPVAPGADDNASGTAATLEVARLAAVNTLPGANCFVLFGAEEFGLWGSRHYVEQLPDAELNAMRAMINLDVMGTEEELNLIGDADLIELARVEAQKLGIDSQGADGPQGAGSDHFSFADAGVPVVFFYRQDELIHTPEDAIDRISARSLEETAAAAYATLAALAGG